MNASYEKCAFGHRKGVAMTRRKARKLAKAQNSMANSFGCAVPGCTKVHGPARYEGAQALSAGGHKSRRPGRNVAGVEARFFVEVCRETAAKLAASPKASRPVATLATADPYAAFWSTVPSGRSVPTVGGVRGMPRYA